MLSFSKSVQLVFVSPKKMKCVCIVLFVFVERKHQTAYCKTASCRYMQPEMSSESVAADFEKEAQARTGELSRLR